MDRKRCTILSILILAASLFIAGSSYAVTLRMNADTSSGMISIRCWPNRPGGALQRNVEKYSNGEIKLDIKEKLYGIADSLDAVIEGRIDISNQLVAGVTGTYPLLDFGAVPGLFGEAPNTGYEWNDAFLDPRMMEIQNKHARKAGFIIIGGTNSESTMAIWGGKPVRTLEEFKGLKIRCGGLTQTLALKEVGASALTLSMQEVEEALSKGTVDAIFTNQSFAMQRGLFDLCKYVSLWPNFGQIFPDILAINVKKWDKLTPKQQEALFKAATDVTRATGPVTEQITYSYPAWIATTHIKVVRPEASEIAKAQKLMANAVRGWLKIAGPDGPEVLRIALEHATGPGVELISQIINE